MSLLLLVYRHDAQNVDANNVSFPVIFNRRRGQKLHSVDSSFSYSRGRLASCFDGFAVSSKVAETTTRSEISRYRDTLLLDCMHLFNERNS